VEKKFYCILRTTEGLKLLRIEREFSNMLFFERNWKRSNLIIERLGGNEIGDQRYHQYRVKHDEDREWMSLNPPNKTSVQVYGYDQILT